MTLIDLTDPSLRERGLESLPVAIIGAGPVGLAAAANLVERGIEFVIYEAGDEIASSIRQWGHTRLFSPWKHVVDPASRRLLETTGWQLPDSESLPTGTELVERYLEPLSALDVLARRIRTGVRIEAVTRQGKDRTHYISKKTRTPSRHGSPSSRGPDRDASSSTATQPGSVSVGPRPTAARGRQPTPCIRPSVPPPSGVSCGPSPIRTPPRRCCRGIA
jgi:cation diffusion facilitator CzcD-associated flavoprotein CzcO